MEELSALTIGGCGIFMVMSIFPHLRGSLYNTDLYQYLCFL